MISVVDGVLSARHGIIGPYGLIPYDMPEWGYDLKHLLIRQCKALGMTSFCIEPYFDGHAFGLASVISEDATRLH